MGHRIDTTIDIAAEPAVVWSVLTDVERYEEWNPFIVSSTGAVEVGGRLTNRMLPPGGKAMTFRPRVTAVEPARVFEWLGRLVAPGVFDGRHRFALDAVPGGTRLHHSESFSGLLVPLLRRSLDTRTRAGFVAMNEALKARAEAT